MMKIRNSLAGLLLLAFLAVPAFAGTAAFQTGHDYTAWALWLTAAGLLGTVTITYKFQLPTSTTLVNSVTAPTAAQAGVINSFTAVVFMSDTEVTGTITHNWKLSTNALALLFPWVGWYWTTYGTAGVSFALTDSSTVTITKLSGTGSGGTFNVWMMRPHTILGPSTT